MATTFTITKVEGQILLSFSNGYTKYLNACGFEIEVQSNPSTNYVYIGDSTFNTTQSYLNCTAPSPAGLTVYQWIDDVLVIVGECGGGGGGVVSITQVPPLPFAYFDLTDVANPIFHNVEYNTRSVNDPSLAGANDRETIQNTVDAVVALGGGTVVIPAGNYTIDGAIDLSNSSGLAIKGEGNPVIEWTNDTGAFSGTTVENLVIEGLTITTELTSPTSWGIELNSSSKAILRENTIIGSGVYFDNSNGNIENNYFRVWALGAVMIPLESNSDNIVQNNYFTNGIGSTPHRNGDNFSTYQDWQPNTGYFAYDMVQSGSNMYLCKTGGTSDPVTSPTAKTDNVVDGSVVWSFLQTVDFSHVILPNSASYSNQQRTIISKNTFFGVYCGVTDGQVLTQVINNKFNGCVFGISTDLANGMGQIGPTMCSYNLNDFSFGFMGIYLVAVNDCASYGNINISGNNFWSNQSSTFVLTGSVYLNVSELATGYPLHCVKITDNTTDDIQNEFYINFETPADFTIERLIFSNNNAEYLSVSPGVSSISYILCTNNMITTIDPTSQDYPAGSATVIYSANLP